MSVEVYCLNQWRSVHDRVFTTQEARRVLQVRSPTTWARCLNCLDISGQRGFAMADLTELFKLRLFLRFGFGNSEFGYAAYRRYRTQPALLRLIFRQWKIDLDREIERFQSHLLEEL